MLLILFVTDLFHPVDNFTFELFLNGDVRHGRGRRGSMPVLLTGRKPDHIAGADFLDRPAPMLCPAATGGHHQGLTEWMRMPRRPRARLERYAGALNPCRIVCLRRGLHSYQSRLHISAPLS